MSLLIRLLLLLISLPVSATVFQMQSVDQQILEADGIVMGNFLRSQSIKLDDGAIATQMIFKMNKEFGMQSDFFQMDEIIVHYPGGKLGDEHVVIDGVPQFVPGENVVLMIKSHENRFWGQNLGFGTFRIINYGNEKLMVNSIFPTDLRVSQVKIEDFERSVRKIKGSSLRVVMATDYPTNSDASYARAPASVEEGKNRAIASKIDQEENRSAPAIRNFWLIALLALLGGTFRFLRQKESK